MGLSVGIGTLAFLLEHDAEGAQWLEKGLAAANRLLAESGLPAHVEPRSLGPLNRRLSIRSVPYSFIHYLRRAYAHRLNSPTWVADALPSDVDPTKDPVLDAELCMFNSHLICHSDAEGFYLPVDFQEILFASSTDSDIPGGMVGSSQRLMAELIMVAPALGIDVASNELSDAEASRIDGLARSEQGIFRELSCWLLLYESARLSIQHKTAIVMG